MPEPSFKYGINAVGAAKQEYYAKYHTGQNINMIPGGVFVTSSRSVQSCGLYEISSGSFYYAVKNFKDNRLRCLENLYISSGLCSAGIILTLSSNQGAEQKELLDQLLHPGIDLGQNRNHSPWNKIYLYQISLDELEKRIADEKHKIEDAAKKEADKLSAANQVTAPKSSGVKRRATIIPI